MAVRVDEIMNRELYAADLDDRVGTVRKDLVRLGVSGAPVLDEAGRPLGVVSLKDLSEAHEDALIVDHVSYPPIAVHAGTLIKAAARLMGETGCHRLVVVDDDRAVGIISTIDVVRALIGMPAAHPATFPHYDAKTGVTWTDDLTLDGANVERAPRAPGVLLIVNGKKDRPEVLIWGEASENIQERLLEYLETPAGGPTALSYWREVGDLRFRTATVVDPDERRRVLEDVMR